jgi:hypothetical protein
VRSASVAQESRPDKEVYGLTPDGREALARWVDEVAPPGRVRDAFFSKFALALTTRLVDPVVLIDRQRRAHLHRLRELNELAAATTGPVARLAVEAPATSTAPPPTRPASPACRCSPRPSATRPSAGS